MNSESENIKLRLMMELQQECKERELLSQAFNNFVVRMDSKIEDCQSVGHIMLGVGKDNKERINGMNATIGECLGYSAQALKQVKKTDDKFNKLWMRIFFSIVGSILLSQTILFAAFFMFVQGR